MWQSGLPVVWRIAGRAGVVDAGEGVLGGGGADRVDRDLDVAVGAVLEADRHREAGAELAVGLALRGARADRPPGDRVGDVLRRDRVEELAADREAELDHLEQQLAGDPQAGVDVGGAVEVRVVDQALPADRRPRLLEVDAHDDEHVVLQLARLGGEAVGVVERGFRVVDAARADDDHQPRVAPVEDVDDFLAAADDRLGALLAQRQLADQVARRRQLDDFGDPLFTDAVPFCALHPDDHFPFAFLQNAAIVTSPGG